jgi:uncharacterized phage protein gp47/JayE
MARPEFTSRFEEAEETIQQRVVDRLGDEWRKEPGDFIHDAVAPTPLEIKQLQVNQDFILKNTFAQFAEEEYLDYKLAEVGLNRMQATFSQRKISITADAGVIIPAGHTVSVVILDGQGNPVEYTVDQEVSFTDNLAREVSLTCKEAGSVGNVPDGSEFIILPPIPGVRSISDLGSTIPARDKEADEAAWKRYDFKVRHPDTGGNKNDYIRWSSEVTGVGKSKTIPRWAGTGTVKVVIVDNAYKPASQILVDEVQEYLDPGSEGLGEGKAPMGAAVTVTAAKALPVDIAATVMYDQNVDKAAVKAEFEKRVKDYLIEIVFTDYAVAFARIGAILVTTAGVLNYSGLTLNGVAGDVPVDSEEVATLSTVVI